MIRIGIEIGVEQFLAARSLSAAMWLHGHENRVDFAQYVGVVELEHPAGLILVIRKENAETDWRLYRKAINLDALAVKVIRPLVTKAGCTWHGWHAFRRGLATNLHRLGIPDKVIQRILRHSNVAVTQGCYIKTADADATAAMQQFERLLEYAPSMHLSGAERPQIM